MRFGNTAVLMAIAAAAGCATLTLPAAIWSADVQPRGGSAVQANVQAHSVSGVTSLAISMIGGDPGGEHPWHIHSGACGSGGGIVGDAAEYPTLRPNQAGAASVETRVRSHLRQGEEYHVNVHRSPQAMGQIIGCGNMRMN